MSSTWKKDTKAKNVVYLQTENNLVLSEWGCVCVRVRVSAWGKPVYTNVWMLIDLMISWFNLGKCQPAGHRYIAYPNFSLLYLSIARYANLTPLLQFILLLLLLVLLVALLFLTAMTELLLHARHVLRILLNPSKFLEWPSIMISTYMYETNIRWVKRTAHLC